ncbi:MAG: hypothetical protein ACFFG0_13105 [Candidatus Thorarchaeota archaeon]
MPQPEKRDLPKDFQVLIKDNKLISSLNPLEVEELEVYLIVQNREVWERFKDEVLSGIKIANQDFVDKIYPINYSLSFKVDKILE